MIEIKAPSRLTLSQYNSPNKIFLGGSIEMGSAEKWQDKIVKSFKDHDIVFLNPRFKIQHLELNFMNKFHGKEICNYLQILLYIILIPKQNLQ